VTQLRTVGFLLAALASLAQVQAPDPLARARQLYNEQKYEEAIQAASEARKIPANVNAASVVFARAHLELFRTNREAGDLADARDALASVDSTGLSARDRVELVVGLGELLYLDGCLDGCYTAAAELFELALARDSVLEPPARDLIFEWWAGALDRQAQYGMASQRKPVYQRILIKSEAELAKNDQSVSATYWLAAAARGVEDYERAWGAAIAGWVRARYRGEAGATLRIDLDRFVTLVLMPERARQITPGGDARPALASLQAQWEDVKKKYSPDRHP
jgi:hypothetical protein